MENSSACSMKWDRTLISITNAFVKGTNFFEHFQFCLTLYAYHGLPLSYRSSTAFLLTSLLWFDNRNFSLNLYRTTSLLTVVRSIPFFNSLLQKMCLNKCGCNLIPKSTETRYSQFLTESRCRLGAR